MSPLAFPFPSTGPDFRVAQNFELAVRRELCGKIAPIGGNAAYCGLRFKYCSFSAVLFMLLVWAGMPTIAARVLKKAFTQARLSLGGVVFDFGLLLRETLKCAAAQMAWLKTTNWESGRTCAQKFLGRGTETKAPRADLRPKVSAKARRQDAPETPSVKPTMLTYIYIYKYCCGSNKCTNMAPW